MRTPHGPHGCDRYARNLPRRGKTWHGSSVGANAAVPRASHERTGANKDFLRPARPPETERVIVPRGPRTERLTVPWGFFSLSVHTQAPGNAALR